MERNDDQTEFNMTNLFHKSKHISHSFMSQETILNAAKSLNPRGWSGGAMVLGKLPVPGRPTI